MTLFGKPNVKKLAAKRKTKALIKYVNYAKDHNIRYDAIQALGTLNSRDAIEPIKENLLLEKEYSVKYLSVNVLESLGWLPVEQDKLAAIFWDCKKEYAKCASCGVFAIEPLIDRVINGDYKAMESYTLIGRPALEYLISNTNSIFDYYKNFTSGIGEMNFMQQNAHNQAKQIDKITKILGYCVHTIGKFNMPECENYLIDLYHTVKESIYSNSAGGFSDIYKAVEVREDIVSAIKNTYGIHGIQFLIEILEKEPAYFVRWAAVDCFEKIAEKSLIIIKNERVVTALNIALQKEPDNISSRKGKIIKLLEINK